VAVAISDGTHTATYVRGKPGGQVDVWETANPANALKPTRELLAAIAQANSIATEVIAGAFLTRAQRAEAVAAWESRAPPKGRTTCCEEVGVPP
jgi:hypothetical protein